MYTYVSILQLKLLRGRYTIRKTKSSKLMNRTYMIHESYVTQLSIQSLIFFLWLT